MLFLLRNGQLRLKILFLALLFTGGLCPFPEITEAYDEPKRHCETCGMKYDDCPSSKPAVECPETSFCFKTYNTSINRLQKGCSNGTTHEEWETIIRLASAWVEKSVCFDATEANLAMIKECQENEENQWNSSCRFITAPRFNQGSQGAPDVSKMTSKMCICGIDLCNAGDVPGFEEIQRAKVEEKQCYACNTYFRPRNRPCSIVKSDTETELCQAKYCSITKQRRTDGYNMATKKWMYTVVLTRDCADHYEDPAKTFECLKGSKGGCMDVKKLRKCSPIKPDRLEDMQDYKEDDPGEDMKECICEGKLCNDKSIDDIKLKAGAETSLTFNKKLIIILMVPALFEAFCSKGLGL